MNRFEYIEEFITIKNHSIFTKYYGIVDSSVPTIVLLHDGLGSTETWGDLPELLLSRFNVNIIAYDRRGYGRSSSFDFTSPKSTFLEDEAIYFLPEILAFYGVKKPIFLGHSDGASIALIFAGFYNSVDTSVISISAHSFIQKVTLEGIDELRKRIRYGDFLEKLERNHFNKAENLFYYWSNAWRSKEMLKFNIFEYLKKIKAPVLLLQGDSDQFGTAAQLHTIRNLVQGSVDYKFLQKCGHFPLLEKKEETLEQIFLFLNKIFPNKT